MDLVAAPVAVIRSGKERDDIAIVLPEVALHDKLVRTGQELQTYEYSKLVLLVMINLIYSNMI